MTNDHSNRERQRIHELANEYGSKGYDVVFPRTKFDVPEFLKDEEYIPDLVVTSANEKLIIEVKTTESVRHDKHLAKISELVNGNPGWQFLFVLTNPKRGEPQSAPPLRSSRWRELLDKSRQSSLQTPELTEAAFVLAWAALEGAVREASASEVANAEKSPTAARTPMSQLRNAVIWGLIDRKDLSRLEALFKVRNCIVHAMDGPRPSIADVVALQEFAEDVGRNARQGDA